MSWGIGKDGRAGGGDMDEAANKEFCSENALREYWLLLNKFISLSIFFPVFIENLENLKKVLKKKSLVTLLASYSHN